MTARVRPGEPGRATPSLGRATRTMAVATLVSRLTGFARSVVLVAAIGLGLVGDAYNTANTLPNIVYELLLGGVLSSVIVPLLVHARARDADDGVAYTQRLLTLVTVVLAVATVLAVLAAPLLTWAYGIRDDPEQVALANVLARILLLEIVFYGVGALLTAVLNSRQVFGPPAWAPVLNNVVVIATGVVFIGLHDGSKLTPATISPGLVWLLGIGTTLGIVVQALALLPSLHRAGVPWVWRWDWRGAGLGEAGRLSVWVLGYVVVSQVGYLVILNLANDAGRDSATGPATGVGSTVYANASLLFQLPYGVIGVALLTALLPRMSKAAAAGDTTAVVADLSLGARLTAVALLPVSALLVALGPAIAVVAFARNQVGPDEARVVGVVLAASAFGLLPYAVTMLQLRVFYAMKDARTPTLINLAMVAVRVPLCLAVPVLVPAERVVLWLAVANSVSFVVGAVVGEMLLRRRLGGLDTVRVLRTVGWLFLASVAGGLAAWAVAGPVENDLPSGALGSALAVLAGSLVGGTVLLLGCLVLPVPEVRGVLAAVAGRLGARVPGLRARGSGVDNASGSSPERTSKGGRVVRSAGQDGGGSIPVVPPEGTGSGLDPGAGPESTVTPGLQAPPTLAMSVPPAPPAPTPTPASRDHPVTLAGRYRLVERSGTDLDTGHGRLSTWRATDELLRRDVLLRIHAPGGDAAAEFLSRALSAGALSHPALAMVYDAVDEGRRAYVVSEWVDGATLAEALRGGPLSERDARETIRRLAEGVAQAHTRGIAVGGLTLERVMLTRGGSVCVSAIPAPEATQAQDVRALGVLLFATLAGFPPNTGDQAELERQLTNAAAPDLANVALALLGGRVRSASDVAELLVAGRRRRLPTDDGGLAFITDRYEYEPLEAGAGAGPTPPKDGAVPLAEQTRPVRAVLPEDATVMTSVPVPVPGAVPTAVPASGPVPPAVSAPVGPGTADGTAADYTTGAALPVHPPTGPDLDEDTGSRPLFGPGGLGWADTDHHAEDEYAGAGAGADEDDRPAEDRADADRHDRDDGHEDGDREEGEGSRRAWLVLAFPIAALLAVALVAWVIASTFTSIGRETGVLPPEDVATSASASASGEPAPSTTPTTTPAPSAAPLPVTSVTVFDPSGDGASENGESAPLAVDGDPATSWPTLTYQGSPALGNLKPGVGLVFDLGSPVTVQQVVISTDQPGSTIEVRAGSQPGGEDLEAFPVAGRTELAAQSTVATADAPASRYWVVWVTGLVPDDGAFSASIAEVQFVGLPAA